MVKIILIGPQGSGKGTYAKIISEKFDIPHISTGEMIRGMKNELSKEIQDEMNSGKLISDEIIMEILKKGISKPDCEKGFILDGTPRNLNQVKLLEKITKIDKVIEITLDDSLSIKRISGRVSCEKCKEGYNLITEPKPKNPHFCDKCRGKLIRRADDTEEAIKKRLDTYHKETEPIVNYYRNVIKINGDGSIDDVANEILNLLEE